MSKPRPEGIRRRLLALEQSAAALGIRIFQQSLDAPSIFYEMGGGEAYTRSDISELARSGWQCIKIVYEDSRPQRAPRMRGSAHETEEIVR